MFRREAGLQASGFHGASSFQKTVRRGPIVSALCLLVAVPLVIVSVVRTKLEGEELKWKLRDTMGGFPRVNTGAYTGKLWKTEQTLGTKTLGETSFARCDVHSVVSADHKNIINDWIFLEERDHINVAVYTKGGKFLLFQQRKYAIPGETLSPVGGFINDGESPFDAARREVMEELGVGSTFTLENMMKETKSKPASGAPRVDEYGIANGRVPDEEQSQWVFLGRYRSSANRGGGFIYSYLLKDAVPVTKGGGTAEFVRTGDDEEQTLVPMTKQEVAAAVADGQFQEVKWTATMSLSLLHMQSQEPKNR